MAAKASERFVIGVDFGTLSARAVVVGTTFGETAGSASAEYPSGVIDRRLPDSAKPLRADTALQDPGDYLFVLRRVVRKAVKEAGIRPDQIAGLGTDFTCCTVLPTTGTGEPLCQQPRWRNNPDAWVKLWKHHAAQPEADLINTIAQGRGEAFLKTYGGKYSSEWLFSKLLETLRKAPGVFHAAERFIEAGDWIVWQLTGQERRGLSAAGFKAMRVADSESGFPEPAFFEALAPGMRDVVERKLAAAFLPPGACAGGLTAAWAKELGLPENLPVAVGNIDAHVAVPACGVTEPGKLVMIMGTSTCHLLLAKERQLAEGICGVVKDGVVPGLWAYEAGQAGVGDLFAWFIENGVPARVQTEAKRAGLGLHEWLERAATKLKPGATGLLALDWWNGNRSVLVDAELTGLILGLKLSTQPHEIYRALLEATAFGTRRIIEAFTSQGIEIEELHACGGLAEKNALLLQIYADVTGRPIKVAAAAQASAFGAAMHGAVAAGVFADLGAAARAMTKPPTRTFLPRAANTGVYDRLYAEYLRLHDQLGRDPASSMKKVKQIRDEVAS